MTLSVEDRFELQNLLGRYCHLIDNADPAWADLFTDDAVLAGIMPEPVVGKDALRHVPQGSLQVTNGFFRHHLGSIVIDAEGEGARILAYNLVTDWSGGGKFILFARYNIYAARTDAGWRLQRVDTQVDQ